MTAMPGDLGCTCFRLRQAARLVSRSYDGFLAPCGISIGQFGVLATLAAMDGASISELAQALQMERTTLTRNLLPLQSSGYVSVQAGPDRRARALSLTKLGREVLSAAKPLWRAAQRTLEKELGRSDVKSLNTVLDGTLNRLTGS
jgi:DNA-binding MarR family transcriptional regulator